MVQRSVLGLLCLPLGAWASPFTFPNEATGSFPDIQVPSQELNETSSKARGTLPGPNAPPLTGLNNNTLQALQLIAFNEIFEVAFFSSLYANITNNETGFTEFESDEARALDLESIQAIVAQEELHALTANVHLKANGLPEVQPCAYSFPSTNITQALFYAITFTDVVLGTLGAAQGVFAADGDLPLVPLFASVIGQEAEQVGGFRSALGRVPSELPFLTAGAPIFAFSALNHLFVSDCPDSNYTGLSGAPAPADAVQGIPVPILGGLVADPAIPDPVAQTINYTATLDDASASAYADNATSALALTYINQQNAPRTVPVADVVFDGLSMNFTAEFPYDTTGNGSYFGNGLTIAAVTVTGGAAFTNASDVAAAAVAGPALFVVN